VENAAVLCENHCERVQQIKLAHLEKKKKKEKHFGRQVNFRLVFLTTLYSATGCVVHHENTQR